MSLSLSRIPAPTGRVENKAQTQRVVKTYSFQRDNRDFLVVGYNTPKEEHMLKLAWEFYTHAVDIDQGIFARPPNHFEMFARFFVDDRDYGVKRTLPGLYAFLWESGYMLDHKDAFWPDGHPSEVKSDEDLRRRGFNMKLLARNIRWFVDTDTRFWNTLEFRIGEGGADVAKILYDEYVTWIQAHGLVPGNGYLQMPASAFDRAALESGHPFFTNRAGRLDPSVWKNGRAPANKPSPVKRKTASGQADAAAAPGTLEIVRVSRAQDEVEEDETVEVDRSKQPRSDQKSAGNVELSLVPLNPNPLNASASMQLEPVSARAQSLLRVMMVPLHGVDEGGAPLQASVFQDSISLSLAPDKRPVTTQLPHGVSNTGDNVISIIYNKMEKTRQQLILVVLVTDEKTNKPVLVVRDVRVNGNVRKTSDTRTELVLAAPKDCHVSWDGRRIAINDAMHNVNRYWVRVFDFVPDDTGMLALKTTVAEFGDPIRACTNSVLATEGEFIIGSIAAPKIVPLNPPQEQNLKFLNATSNAWMQPSSGQMEQLNEARKHTVFVHLYSRRDRDLVARVTPVSEDGADVDSKHAFTVEYQLPEAYPPRRGNDNSVSCAWWYPLPSYASLNVDQLSVLNIDPARDRALVIWCIHKNFAVVTTAPASDADEYMPPVTLASEYMPTPILNNLLLQVHDSDFNVVNVLDFKTLTRVLHPDQ